MPAHRQTVYVPAGTYQVGSDHGRADEAPMMLVTVDAFEMDCFPVTVAEVQQILTSAGLPLPAAWNEHAPDNADFPATQITAIEAESVARLTGRRLPTEVEWEIAAGSAFQRPEFVHARPGAGPLPLANAETCQQMGLCTPEGLVAMVGMVWQWTASIYDWHGGQLERRFPVRGDARVVRGGIWSAYDARNSFRSMREPLQAYSHVGFRCVRDLTEDAN